jgi:hypothetical protein
MRICECCGQIVKERRHTCHRCDRKFGLCCQGDIKGPECSPCYSVGDHIRSGLSINHQR